MTSSPQYRANGITDRGKKRSTNQDTILIDDAALVYVQADGMGGHKGGAEASELASRVVHDILTGIAATAGLTKEDRSILSGLSPASAAVRGAILAADNMVTKTGEGNDRALAGMGSTIDVLTFVEDIAIVGHVGDSRVYRYRGSVLSQLTEDHSVLNELRRRLKLKPDQLVDHPYKNRVTHALGYLPDRRVDMIEQTTLPGDIYILCSDGLSGVIDNKSLADVIAKNKSDLKNACEQLVKMANDKGGPDNISVIIVERFDNSD